jgi:hypothetical protein
MVGNPKGIVKNVGKGAGRLARAAREASGPSQRMLNSYRRQLERDGIDSLKKALRTTQQKLAEHLQKLEEIQLAGGYTSSVEREIRTYQNQIEAINRVLAGQ